MPDATPITEFALVDPGLMRVNLFRPLPRRGRSVARDPGFKEEIEHDGRRLRVISPYVLGADDLRILLALLALAGIQREEVEAKKSEESSHDIIGGLRSQGEFAAAVHLRVRTSPHVLCREAGLKVNGAAYGRISESLARIGLVTYIDLGLVSANARSMRVGGGEQHLLSARVEEASCKVVVVLNMRFARAILGAAYMRIDLVESRSLREMARLLHFRFSVVVREGGIMNVHTDRLGEWIFGGVAVSTRQRSRRREEIRRGMAGLGQLPGWLIVENRRQLFAVTRPSRRDVSRMR